MTKRWTQHQARTNQLVDAEQFQQEQVAHRGSFASLDRSQVPLSLTLAMFKQGAMHRVWRFKTNEQTLFRDSGTPDDAWQCVTFKSNYASGYHIMSEHELTDHRGGHTLFEWSGGGLCLGIGGKSASGGNAAAMEKFLNLRIVVNGVVVAETLGLAAGVESFRLTGSTVLPPGDHKVSLQFQGSECSDLDPIEDYNANWSIMQYHVVNSILLVIGRFR